MSEQNKTPLDDAMLEALFAARRAEADAAAEPDTALMAAILRDAETEQARMVPRAASADPAARRSFWPDLRDALGGWMGMGGLAAATIASVWIGMSVNLTLPGDLAALLGAEPTLVDPVSGFDFVWDEG